MSFNSLEYLFFLPAVAVLFYLLPHKFRWVLLLAASYFFYMYWRAEYALLIATSTLVDYFCGLQMGKEPVKEKRKPYLYFSLLANLGLLFAFKYFNFFNTAALDLAVLLDLPYAVSGFEMLLPVGISFYTFQTLSYSIDVYNGRIKPEKNLGIFALFVSFFPQLVAGPIERAGNLITQLKQKQEFSYFNITSGLKRIAWGLFKKVVIADRLAAFVNVVYNNPTDYEGLPLMLATIFFAFQIYCDFSGYTDIAIGSAQVLGIRLMENFRQPYFATSIPDFWRRWHISLTTWFRDYVYIPLGGNRVVKWRWYYNLFLVFLLSGLWHGANWTFIAWGALHGFYQILFTSSKNLQSHLVRYTGLSKVPVFHKSLQLLFTFGLVCFAWIFFRANSMADAKYIISHLFSNLNLSNSIYLHQPRKEFVLALFFILTLLLVHLLQHLKMLINITHHPSVFVRWSVYSFLVLCIIFFGIFRYNAFIYFQF